MVLDGAIDITVLAGFTGGIASKLGYDVLSHHIERRRQAKRETKGWYEDMMKCAKEVHIDVRMYRSNLKYFTTIDPDTQEYLNGPKATDERLEKIKMLKGWEDKNVSGLTEAAEDHALSLRVGYIEEVRDELRESMEMHVSRLRELLSTQPDGLDDEIITTISTLLEHVNKIKTLKKFSDSDYEEIQEVAVEVIEQCDDAIDEMEGVSGFVH